MIESIAEAIEFCDRFGLFPTVWLLSRLTGIDPAKIARILSDFQDTDDFSYRIVNPWCHPDPVVSEALNARETLRLSELDYNLVSVSGFIGVSPVEIVRRFRNR